MPRGPCVDVDELEFREACEGCGAHLSWIDIAYICGQECTWCQECAEGDGMVCRNCSGELRRRPRRTRPIGR